MNFIFWLLLLYNTSLGGFIENNKYGVFKKEGKYGGMRQIVSSQQLVSSLSVGELSSVLATPGKVNIISKRWNYIFDATIRPILYGQLDVVRIIVILFDYIQLISNCTPHTESKFHRHFFVQYTVVLYYIEFYAKYLYTYCST